MAVVEQYPRNRDNLFSIYESGAVRIYGMSVQNFLRHMTPLKMTG